MKEELLTGNRNGLISTALTLHRYILSDRPKLSMEEFLWFKPVEITKPSFSRLFGWPGHVTEWWFVSYAASFCAPKNIATKWPQQSSNYFELTIERPQNLPRALKDLMLWMADPRTLKALYSYLFNAVIVCTLCWLVNLKPFENEVGILLPADSALIASHYQHALTVLRTHNSKDCIRLKLCSPKNRPDSDHFNERNTSITPWFYPNCCA